MARKLEIEIVGDARSYERALGRASHASTGFGSSLGKMAKAGAFAAGAAGVGALVVTLKTGFEEIMESQKVMAQTNAVIKSTGGIAKVTAKDVETLAQAISRTSGVDDELIQSGENLLLTFKNVRNELGAGNAVFDRATQSAVDLSVAGFGSVESAAKMMGKALNDPIAGMTALGRAGVTFSEEQKKTIAALVETGDVLGAQKVILAEVESQVGGSAKAYGETLPGQLAKAKNAFAEVSGELAVALLPAVTKALDGFNRFIGFVQANMPAWKAAVVENSRPVIEILTRLWAWIQENLIPVFMQLARVAIEQWTAIAKVFQEHGPEIRRIIERVTAVVKPLIEAWLFLAQNVVIPIIKPLFTVVIPTALAITIGIVDKLTGAIEAVIEVFKWLATNAGKLMQKMADAITAPIEAAIALVQRLADVVNAVRAAVRDLLDQIDNISLPSLPGVDIPFVGGGRQHGGPVSAGTPYLVGERGMELFVPNASGRIIPNHRLGVAGGMAAPIIINVHGSILTEGQLVETVRRGLYDIGRRNPGIGFALS